MKKHIAAVIALFLILSFNGWAGGKQEAAAPEAEKKALPPMDKIIYLTTDYHDEPDSHDAWQDAFKRITGVDVELKTVSSKDADESMVAMLMGGEKLDVIKFGSDDITAPARQEFIIPLDKFIENSPEMKKLKSMFPSSFAAHSWNGVVYGIPEKSGSNRGLWVRTDILKKLGLSMPRTLDEFVDSLKKIRDNYPAGDGSRMFPYISKTYHHGYIAVLGNYFDVSIDPAIRRPGDAKYRDGWDTPQFRDYAEFMKMLWDEQLIDPDHALPQKASKTRSKLYAGKGAFLAMWTYRYPSMIEELKENFPEGELALVPPIKNPKGGVLGLSVVPGYRPFCITSNAANPQFVWDKFIETVILTTEGSMLQFRGIPGVSYKVVDNTFKDNFEESGLHMKNRPPLNPNIKFPYKLPPLMERGMEMEEQFNEWFSENSTYAVAEEPIGLAPSFDMIYDDMKDKKNELFWKYVMGEHSFEEMMKQFAAHKKEVDFDNVLAEINGKL